uniref:EF-hand domain-containing protein n=1 Tax=Setaria digitata TaxID=48799 RepID=A0A915PV48_9BILA
MVVADDDNEGDEIDYDGDRRLTLNELKKWRKTNHVIKTDKELERLIQLADKNYDGSLSIAEYVTLVLTRKPIRQSEQIFKRLDVNGDGELTENEAMGSKSAGISEKIINGIFELSDFNRDGKITLDEFSLMVDNNPTAERQPKTQAEQNRDLAQQLMTIIDQNQDKNLSLEEVHSFANANARVSKADVIEAFGYLDANHDTFLNFDELVALPDKMVALVHFREPPPVSDN